MIAPYTDNSCCVSGTEQLGIDTTISLIRSPCCSFDDHISLLPVLIEDEDGIHGIITTAKFYNCSFIPMKYNMPVFYIKNTRNHRDLKDIELLIGL